MKELLLFFLALFGSLLILFSFLSVEVRNVDFKMFGIGSLMILSVIGYGIWAALAPPTSGKTEEETRDKPISIAASLKETLDGAIYAYDYPSWPIAKELAQCSRQPKVGNNAFCKHMESNLSGRMVYFVNESDVFPRVPPSFEHFGSLVWYKAGGIRRSQPPMLAMRSGAESIVFLTMASECLKVVCFQSASSSASTSSNSNVSDCYLDFASSLKKPSSFRK